MHIVHINAYAQYVPYRTCNSTFFFFLSFLSFTIEKFYQHCCFTTVLPFRTFSCYFVNAKTLILSNGYSKLLYRYRFSISARKSKIADQNIIFFLNYYVLKIYRKKKIYSALYVVFHQLIKNFKLNCTLSKP